MKSAMKDRIKLAFDPLVTFLSSSGVHPNVLTVLGLGFGVVAGATAATGRIREAALWLLVSGIFDVVDGSVARRRNVVSRRGAFLDSTLDRYSEAAFFAGLLWHYATDAAAWTVLGIFLFVTASFLVSYVRARAEGLGTTCTVGLMERPERMIATILACLVGGPVLPGAIWVLALLTHATALHRLWHVFGRLEA